MNKRKRQQVRTQAEGRLQRALLSFFRGQSARILAKVADGQTAAPFIDADEDKATLWDTLKKPLSRSVAEGAALELIETRKLLPKAAPVVPERLSAVVEAAIDEWGERPWWTEVTSANDFITMRLMDKALAAGWSATKILQQVKALLAATAMTRASTIATTTATEATSSGAEFGLDELAQEITEAVDAEVGAETGLGKMWFSVGDDKVRESHAALDNVRIPRGEMFNVGGEMAPYPGSYMLSPGEAYNCRCGIMGALLEEPE